MSISMSKYLYLYSAFLLPFIAAKALKLFSVLMGSQFYLAPAHFITARAEQDLEHYIRDYGNELLDVAAHFSNPRRMEA
jgi:hypothetical protein